MTYRCPLCEKCQKPVTADHWFRVYDDKTEHLNCDRPMRPSEQGSHSNLQSAAAPADTAERKPSPC